MSPYLYLVLRFELFRKIQLDTIFTNKIFIYHFYFTSKRSCIGHSNIISVKCIFFVLTLMIMTIFSKPITTPDIKQKRKIIPLIHLEYSKTKKLHRREYQSYKLQNIPGNNNSSMYELLVPYFKSGSYEE